MTETDKFEFIELRSLGESMQAIAEKLNVSRQTLYNWQTEMTEDLALAKTSRLEALINNYRLATEKRLERYAETLDRIDTELEDRDFSRVSTSVLVRLKIAILQALGKDVNELERVISFNVSSYEDAHTCNLIKYEV